MKKTVSLIYPRSIYADNLFPRAVMDYSGICKIEVRVDGPSVVCAFSESAVDLELTAKEFSNYLVELALFGVSDE